MGGHPVNSRSQSLLQPVSQSDTNAVERRDYDKYEILLEGRDPEEFKKHCNSTRHRLNLELSVSCRRRIIRQSLPTSEVLRRIKKTFPGLAIQKTDGKRIWIWCRGEWKIVVAWYDLKSDDSRYPKELPCGRLHLQFSKRQGSNPLEMHMLETCLSHRNNLSQSASSASSF